MLEESNDAYGNLGMSRNTRTAMDPSELIRTRTREHVKGREGCDRFEGKARTRSLQGKARNQGKQGTFSSYVRPPRVSSEPISLSAPSPPRARLQVAIPPTTLRTSRRTTAHRTFGRTVALSHHRTVALCRSVSRDSVIIPFQSNSGSVRNDGVAVANLDRLRQDGRRPIHVLQPVTRRRRRQQVRAELGIEV